MDIELESTRRVVEHSNPQELLGPFLLERSSPTLGLLRPSKRRNDAPSGGRSPGDWRRLAWECKATGSDSRLAEPCVLAASFGWLKTRHVKHDRQVLEHLAARLTALWRARHENGS